jgi:hypothetical protein
MDGVRGHSVQDDLGKFCSFRSLLAIFFYIIYILILLSVFPRSVPSSVTQLRMNVSISLIGIYSLASTPQPVQTKYRQFNIT